MALFGAPDVGFALLGGKLMPISWQDLKVLAKERVQRFRDLVEETAVYYVL